MIARLLFPLLFASLNVLAADQPAPASGLRKAMSESQKRDAQKAHRPALSGKGLVRRPVRRK